jgi:hypothetical protein
MRLNRDTKSDLYMAALGLSIGVIIVVLVMGAEFIHILTRINHGGF